MLTYIIRRLLLMIPTIIGITFLVFMLIAASPGGIGAADATAQEGQEGSINEAVKQAYLEDRYGLGDPVLLQYLRWLRGVSPIKFGTQALKDPTGRLVHTPKTLEPPPLLGDWYGSRDDLEPQRPGSPPEFTDDQGNPLTGEELDQAKIDLFRDIEDDYSRIRANFVAARSAFERAAAEYARVNEARENRAAADARREAYQARQAGNNAKAAELEQEAAEHDREASFWDNMLNQRDEPKFHRLAEITPDPSIPAGADAIAAGQRAVEAFNTAVETRNRLADAFAATPFPRTGFGITDALTLATPELGYSYARSRPVLDLIFEHLPRTLLLNAIAVPIIYAVAIPAGMIMAVRRGSFIDVAAGATLVALWSIPVVWAGVLLVGFLANNQYLGWFPTGGLQSADAGDMLFLPTSDDEGNFQRGFVLDTLWHITLPVVCLVYAGFAIISKQTRAAMLDNFNADYVRTAKAKGVAPNDVTFKHVFRNSLLPLITLFATVFPAMLAGSVVVERIFSIPGMGSLIIEAIALRDRELLLANTLMIGIVNLLALLLADILYALADPRISYE